MFQITAVLHNVTVALFVEPFQPRVGWYIDHLSGVRRLVRQSLASRRMRMNLTPPNSRPEALRFEKPFHMRAPTYHQSNLLSCVVRELDGCCQGARPELVSE